ncbi:putative G-protein coupled receptor 142 [Acipenser ruthenus]|uniref:Putative G-protein coupled receptor 142 n=1 Tax=Acipenser ruthenus TaxID=7906 RepID=A0A662Z1M9_ACIRT|nr:putative G-protein coupled receptor 142 [Acipenser ruthenus]
MSKHGTVCTKKYGNNRSLGWTDQTDPGVRRRAMIALLNATSSSPTGGTQGSGQLQRSVCVLGFIPVIYYSALLCIGVPVNILTAVVLSRLAARTQKSSYFYLLALTGSDILTQLFIVFVGFLLETAVFHREVPELLLHSISVLEFAANHASIWSAVSLTVDRYLALCHPLRHRQFSYPERTQKVIASPFYWWSDVWRVTRPPTAMDKVLIWTHCTIIYFLPCSIFLVLNSIIIYRLKIRHRKQCREQCQQPAPRRCGKTTAILLALTTAFSILWAPRTFVIIYHLYVSTVNRNWLVHLAYDLANMLAMLNTAVNFFLYCFVSKRFRSGVRDVLLLCGGALPAPHHPLTLKPLSSSLHSSCDGKRLSAPDVTPSHF